jgi:SAM-dependent methyltransferase
VGWPFWAGTSDERVDEALRLAGLRPGERLLDLGCGDGRVLLRAAEAYGARVSGVELGAGLAATARQRLAAAAVDGTVLEADFELVPIEADVVFAFLSPATLQRLRPRLGVLPSHARVVTTGYPVPGWLPNGLGDRVYLYRLPPDEQLGERRRSGQRHSPRPRPGGGEASSRRWPGDRFRGRLRPRRLADHQDRRG